MEVKWKRNEFNDIYFNYLDEQSRFLVFYGGAGSGKSVFIAQRFLYLCLTEPYFRLLFARKVARTIRNSQFQLFKDLIKRGKMDDFFVIKESNMEIECTNGNIMTAVGMDDSEKIKSIQEPSHVWCEEATDFSKEDIMQLNLRLRTKKARFNQVVLSFNPITEEHWINESIFIRDEFKAKIVKSTYLDNKFIDEAYKAQMDALKTQDENYYKVYALGEWGGKVKGAIYTHWKMCDNIPDMADIIYGLDFGFNHPTALIKVGIVGNDIYVQQMIYRSGLTTSDLINQMKGLALMRSPIYADTAMPGAIEEIYRAGFNIKDADKSKGSVKDGINNVKSRGFNITKDSPDLVKEARLYKWAEDRNGNSMDEPVKFLDDGMDAIRYAVHTHLQKKTGKYNISIV